MRWPLRSEFSRRWAALWHTVDTLLVFGSNGRIYSVAVSALPGARGDGQPITTLIDLETGSQPVHYVAGTPDVTLMLSGTGGYGCWHGWVT
jgi:topoisomerase IV subunit A